MDTRRQQIMKNVIAARKIIRARASSRPIGVNLEGATVKKKMTKEEAATRRKAKKAERNASMAMAPQTKERARNVWREQEKERIMAEMLHGRNMGNIDDEESEEIMYAMNATDRALPPWELADEVVNAEIEVNMDDLPAVWRSEESNAYKAGLAAKEEAARKYREESEAAAAIVAAATARRRAYKGPILPEEKARRIAEADAWRRGFEGRFGFRVGGQRTRRARRKTLGRR